MPEVRLIDANALLESLKESVKGCLEWKEEAQDEEIKIRADQARGTFIECALRVKNAPTIEPEVRRGKWLFSSNVPDCILCSKCNAVFDVWHFEAEEMHFCPACGARMDGGADNG